MRGDPVCEVQPDARTIVRCFQPLDASNDVQRSGTGLWDGKQHMERQTRRVEIAGHGVEPGQRVSLDLPAVELATGTWLSIPLEVICGTRPGPCIWLSATIHGEELNGLEIIRRVLKQLDPHDFAGVLIAAPVMNVVGFLNERRTLPDGSDLNRAFPGSEEGSLAERLACFFMREVVAQCCFGIDLHSGAHNRINPPQIRAALDDPETRRLAEAFAAPIMMDASTAEGSLRTAAIEAGKRVLLFEGGEPLRFNEDSLSAGTSGVLRVLHALEMHPVQPAPPLRPSVEVTADDIWVKAPRCGILRLSVDVQAEVRKNQELGVVADALGGKPEKILAPFDGVVIGLTLNPLVAKDGGVLHLAKRA